MNNKAAGRFKGFFNAGVATRLSGGYVVLIIMILLVSIIGITNIQKIRTTYDAVLDERIPRITELQSIQATLSDLNVGARDALLTSDPEKLEKLFTRIEIGRAKIGQQLEVLQKGMEAEGTRESAEIAKEVGNHTSGVLIGLVKYSRYIKANKRDMALTALQEGLQPEFNQLTAHIGEYHNIQIAILTSIKEEVELKERAVIRQTIALLVFSLIVGTTFAWWIVLSVVRPLRDIKAAAGHMAKGDFSHTLNARRNDEVGQVIMAFNQTSVGLSSLIENIRESVNQVNTVAESITTRNTRLENRAMEQTQALNVAMKFIEGVQHVIDENVSLANQATTRASEMANIVNSSSASVSHAVQEMQMVQQSSQKITDIISLIDGIAFQTNILALNAAVEAARAGDQGRGFAVVASEVRSLAGRSAEASKEIKELILVSQARVLSGTQSVQSISKTIDEVNNTAGALRQLVENIASGSEIQSKHMSEMVSSVSNLLSGNDNNVHIVGGMRNNLRDLRDTAHSLTDKVDEFKI